MDSGVRWGNIFDAAVHNDENAVRYFIEMEGVPTTDTNSKEQTIAHIAAINGNLPILEYILDRDPSLLEMLDENKNSPLFLLIERGFIDAVKFLVEFHNVDILEGNMFRFGNNAVHIAAQAGHIDILRYFIEEYNVDVDVKNDLLETPIFYAAEEQHLEVVQYLVEEHDANVTLTDWNGDNILYTSAKVGDLGVPKYLLDEKKTYFDINGRDVAGDTIVCRASRFDQVEFIRYFVNEKQADVNIADNFNRTPLYHAASLGNFETVKCLVECGADPEICDALDVPPDKTTVIDRIIKYLRNAIKEKQNLSKKTLKDEKEASRIKLKEETELKKKEEKTIKNALKEEEDKKKIAAKEEKKRLKMKLKEEKELLKNATKKRALSTKKKSSKTKSLEESIATSIEMRSTMWMENSSTELSKSSERTPQISSDEFSTIPNPSLQSKMYSTAEILSTLSLESITSPLKEPPSTGNRPTSPESMIISSTDFEGNSSTGLSVKVPKEERRRRSLAKSSSKYSYFLEMYSARNYSSSSFFINNDNSLTQVFSNSWHLNSFLFLTDVCFRYLKIFNKKKHQNSSTSSASKRNNSIILNWARSFWSSM